MAEKKKILYIVEAMGGGVFTYIVDLANCANSSCVKECFFRRSRTFSPNFMFATFLWRSYRAVTMCNGICKYSISKMQ